MALSGFFILIDAIKERFTIIQSSSNKELNSDHSDLFKILFCFIKTFLVFWFYINK